MPERHADVESRGSHRYCHAVVPALPCLEQRWRLVRSLRTLPCNEVSVRMHLLRPYLLCWTAWVLPLGASAHDLWIVATTEGTQLRAEMNFGDPGKRDPLIVQRLLDLNLVTATGTVLMRDGTLEPRQIGERPVL